MRASLRLSKEPRGGSAYAADANPKRARTAKSPMIL
jgi:hypothetical protein